MSKIISNSIIGKERLIPKVSDINTFLNYNLKVLKKLVFTSVVFHFQLIVSDLSIYLVIYNFTILFKL